MDVPKKNEWWGWARIACDGVWPSCIVFDYEAFVGFTLNGNRMQLRKAYYGALAIQAANGTKELDLEWFLAVEDTEDDAGELAFSVNADRQTAEVRAKRRGRIR